MIVIDGPCIPKARARTIHRGGKIWSIDPQEHLKNATRLMLRSKWKSAPIESPLNVAIECHIAPPGSISMSKRNILLWSGHPAYRPDLDNYAKYYLDCANGILWDDDSQIIRLALYKRYSETPKTVIRFTQVPTMEIDEETREILTVFSPKMLQDMVQYIRGMADEIDQIFPCPVEGEAGLQSIDERIRARRAAVLLAELGKRYGTSLSKVSKICNRQEDTNRFGIGRPCC